MRASYKTGIIVLLQKIADCLTVCLGFSVGYAFYIEVLDGTVPFDYFEYLAYGAFSALIFLIVLHSAKLYEREISLMNLVETRGLLWVWLISSMFTFTSTFYIRYLDLSRVMVTASLLFTLVFLIIERAIFYRVHLALHLRGFSKRKILIFGAGAVGRHLLKRIYHSPALGLTPMGFLDDDEKLWGSRLKMMEISARSPVLMVHGGLDQLENLIQKFAVKELFLAVPMASYERNFQIVKKCREHGVSVAVVPPMFDNQVYHMRIEELGGIPVLREKIYSPSYPYLFAKRLLDGLFSAVALLLLSPLFLMIGLIIYFHDRGPVFFRQRRVGQGGREFDLFKFRTMKVDSPRYAVNPITNEDPRITIVGRWLRRTSADELPQFFNVLIGNMSIVGPRPEMPFIVEEYDDIHYERLQVRPGITGIWQISSVRGEPIHSNIEYDLFYVENQSLLLDMIIVLRTVGVAIRGLGAF